MFALDLHLKGITYYVLFWLLSLIMMCWDAPMLLHVSVVCSLFTPLCILLLMNINQRQERTSVIGIAEALESNRTATSGGLCVWHVPQSLQAGWVITLGPALKTHGIRMMPAATLSFSRWYRPEGHFGQNIDGKSPCISLILFLCPTWVGIAPNQHVSLILVISSQGQWERSTQQTRIRGGLLG